MRELRESQLRLDVKWNRATILKIIEERGPISRAEIAKQTKLTPPTVSKIVGDFIGRGIVYEMGKGESSGGKRPILLKLNPGAAYVITLDLGREDGIKAALIDVSNKITHQITGPRVDFSPNTELYPALKSLVIDLERVPGISPERIVGICIGVPGIVDFGSRKVTLAPSVNWQIPLAQLDLAEFGIPVFVENDVNLMTLAEMSIGVARGVKNFVFIGERGGIGAGVVIDGSLYTGHRNAAGEIGYMLTDLEHFGRKRGKPVSFENLAGCRAIVERVKDKIDQNSKIAAKLKKTSAEQVSVYEIFKAVQRGDKVVLEIVKETSKFLAHGIANVSTVLDPELVVIGGAISLLASELRQEIKASLQMVLPIVPRIEFSKVGEDGVLIGAATKVFEALKRDGFTSLSYKTNMTV